MKIQSLGLREAIIVVAFGMMLHGCETSRFPIPYTGITVTDSQGLVIKSDPSDWCRCGGTLPTCYSLFPAYPNPANDSTVMRYGLPQIATVRLLVRNRYGQRIVTLVNYDKQIPGYHYVTWHLEDWKFNRVPSDIYRAELEVYIQDTLLVFVCSGDIKVN